LQLQQLYPDSQSAFSLLSRKVHHCIWFIRHLKIMNVRKLYFPGCKEIESRKSRGLVEHKEGYDVSVKIVCSPSTPTSDSLPASDLLPTTEFNSINRAGGINPAILVAVFLLLILLWLVVIVLSRG
jgi:hypothetical protein